MTIPIKPTSAPDFFPSTLFLFQTETNHVPHYVQNRDTFLPSQSASLCKQRHKKELSFGGKYACVCTPVSYVLLHFIVLQFKVQDIYVLHILVK
jgi:hypothetical protein